MTHHRFVLVAPVSGRPCAEDPEARLAHPDDVDQLAALFHTAYRGTLDDDGETLADWQALMGQFVGGVFGQPMWSVSEVRRDDSGPDGGQAALCGATLLTLWHEQPLVTFVATAPTWRRQGLARAGLTRAINRLAAGDEPFVRLVATEGNRPALALYDSLGFRPEGGPIQGPP
jgi:ribosomal protein S18 acetylase RimI-like enzyme